MQKFRKEKTRIIQAGGRHLPHVSPHPKTEGKPESLSGSQPDKAGSDLKIPPSAENVKDNQAVSDIISEIERIAAPGTKVEIVDAVDTTDSELQKGFKSWGLETSDAGKIRGLHRVVKTTKGELRSLIQLVSGTMNPETTPL